MKKFLGFVCLILGLTLLISSIVNIIQPLKNDGVTAYADTIDMPEDAYTLNVNEDDLTFNAVSPFGWTTLYGETMPSFILYCISGSFVLGASTISTINNELQFIESFDLSTLFETTVSLDGFYDDYFVSTEVFISSSFNVAQEDYDYVRFTAQEHEQVIDININSLDRFYTITIIADDAQFTPLDGSSGVYYYILSYYDLDSLFQRGYDEGYSYGYEYGFTQGNDYGYRWGYQHGIEENFNGDLFGSSIVPSINSLMSIELLPNVSFSTIFSIVFGLILIGLCIKIFLGG